MSEGKQFEADWKASYANTPYFYMRLKDSAKWVQGQGATFTPENPCDAIQHTMPFLWLLELKSTKGASISFYPETPWEKPMDAKGNVMIKPNQVKELMRAAKNEGVIPGFVCNFRERKLKTKTVPSLTYFIHINDFIEFAVTSRKSSVSQGDCEKIGVLIHQEKKKVHYRYDIPDFIDRSLSLFVKKGFINKQNLVKLGEWIRSVCGALDSD